MALLRNAHTPSWGWEFADRGDLEVAEPSDWQAEGSPSPASPAKVVHMTQELKRFVDAQDRGGTYEAALAELRSGRKRSHWMWFVFPQVTGLGRSDTARFYALADLDETARYLAHPVLGPRLVECALVLLSLPGSDPVAVFGATDEQKLRSSMTTPPADTDTRRSRRCSTNTSRAPRTRPLSVGSERKESWRSWGCRPECPAGLVTVDCRWLQHLDLR